MKLVLFRTVAIAALALTCGWSIQTLAKDESTKEKKTEVKETVKTKSTEEKKTEKVKDTDGIKFRMPVYYNQLDLDDKQKESIKKIFDDVTPKIEKLEKELEDLKDQRDEKYHKVLTKEQLTKFYELKGKPKGKDEKDKPKKA